jgi:hypothetical protein
VGASKTAGWPEVNRGCLLLCRLAEGIYEHFQARQRAAVAESGVLFEPGNSDGAKFVTDQNLYI